MLQYALKFESILFTFTIIYITFLFLLGPLPLSPHLFFLPSVSSFLHRIVSALSLSHFISLLSLSTPHHCLPLRQNPGRSIKPCHATSHEPDLHSQIAVHHHSHTTRRNSGRSIKPRHATPHKPDLHSQIAVHQHSHTNPTHHIHNNPWPDHHTTPRRRACRAIHHVIGTSHHRISLNRPAVVGFAFGFV